MAKPKIKRADAVLWLSEMKEKGRGRLQSLRQQYTAGQIEIYTLNEAKHRQETISLLLRIFQACDMEPDELLEMLVGKAAAKRQTRLFTQPKNPI